MRRQLEKPDGTPLFLLTACLCCLLPWPHLAAEPAKPFFISVGAARADITPEYPVRLTGYGARKTNSEPGGLQLWAKALAIGRDEDGVALLLTVDNCGVPAPVAEEVASRLKAKAGLLRERIALCSSHTHSGPALAGFATNLFAERLPADQLAAIDRYTRQFIDKLEQVALAALRDRRPATLAWGQGQVGFAANRRTPGGPVDHSLPILCARDPDDCVRAVVANYACHCTTLGSDFNQTCGDWAGFAQEAIEREFPGAMALITIGCGADANPSPREGPDAGLAFAKQHGQALGSQVALLLGRPLTPLTAKLTCRLARPALPFDRHFTREQFEERALKKGIVGYHARNHLERLEGGEQLPSALPYVVQAWSFGDQLAMVFLAGEVVVDYALRLQREFDSARLWVTAYANDAPCYIPSRRILQEGGYEAEVSLWYYGQPTRLAPAVEDTILTTVHAIIAKDFQAR